MANEYLQRTPTSTGNRKVWTWSAWIKRNQIARESYFSAGNSTNSSFGIDYDNSNLSSPWIYDYTSGFDWQIKATQQLRDTGNFFHYLLTYNTTESTSSDRVNIYINGSQISSFSTETYPSANFEGYVNDLVRHTIGAYMSPSFYSKAEITDIFFIDGQALTPEVFGFYKDGNGYISAGSTQSTDFRNGQWVPRTPREIKNLINDNGGFGVNGFYLPMNDDSNFGADFHTTPNSIITLKGENLPQPRNGAPTTTDSYVSQLRTDPYAANLVLAVPGISGGTSSGYGDYSADIKGSGSNKTLTANGNAGVAVTASYYGSALSFDGSGDYLSIANNSDFGLGSNDFTIEYWLYHNAASSSAHIFDIRSASDEDSVTAFYASSTQLRIYLNAADKITVSSELKQNQWTHHAIVRNGSTLTFYQNGVAAGINTTSGDTLRSSAPAVIGAKRDFTSALNGYLQDFRIYKGVAKYTGGFDVPKPYTPVGIGTWRAVSDCTGNNFATMNAVNSSSNVTLSEGNLNTVTSSAIEASVATVGVSTGKWYWEVNVDATPTASFLGITGVGHDNDGTNFYDADQLLFEGGSGSVYYSSYVSRSTTSWGNGDIVKIKLDLDNQTLEYGVNGGSYVGLATITDFDSHVAGETWLPTSKCGSSGGNGAFDHVYNFGQNPSFGGRVALGTYTDSNGKGLFKYEPPSGFLALCEDNLPTPTIKDPGEYFKTVLYAGDGSKGKNITGVGFQPDLVWIKRRDPASSHCIVDSVRGATLRLKSNANTGDLDESVVKSFNDDGFTVSIGSGGENATNNAGETYVAWCWKADGPAVTNTDGSITSRVSVSQDAGFSVITYSGTDTGSSQTIGHGLGAAPKIWIFKNRSASSDWIVYTTAIDGGSDYAKLNATDAFASGVSPWSTAPTSSVITVGTNNVDTCNAGNNYVLYAWAEIEGFSKFGSYVGNGNADGPFVYCGFKPAWVMYKRTDTTGDWAILDSSRQSTNPLDLRLFANNTNVDTTGVTSFDFLSNGFKIRDSAGSINASGGTYIFAAFAESPFTTANAK